MSMKLFITGERVKPWQNSRLRICYLNPPFRQASFGFSQDLGQGPELVEGQISQMYADFLVLYLIFTLLSGG